MRRVGAGGALAVGLQQHAQQQAAEVAHVRRKVEVRQEAAL